MKVKIIGEELICMILKTGEDIGEEISKYVKKNSIMSGSIEVIGAVKDVTFGVYDFKSNSYQRKNFPDCYELVSCGGNISYMDGKPFIHLHASISDHNFNVYGGHLFSCKVTATAEVFIHFGDNKLNRIKQGEFGLIEL
jgi:predicted DNA-binding protein with PD1-like motif